ncbi:uncharacterized protein LOC132069454 [Lycium ferocissimum]|uniref:uncharacterized protein LOC132069454 n=1 Tax=Lycium ferocissimum TaxID=112874 RepID=UPI00281574D1|nr:uncharacterized protein LOC132069454 [Lycium ferocissimum]
MTKFRKLNRPTGHRMSMLRTMGSELVKHERIETTVAKVIIAPLYLPSLWNLGPERTLSAARQAAAFVRGDAVIHKLFTELAYRYKDRAGGYTRMLRTRIRVGDAAEMAYIEFIDRENELRQSKPPNPQPPQRPAMDPWTRSRLSRQFAPPKEEKLSTLIVNTSFSGKCIQDDCFVFSIHNDISGFTCLEPTCSSVMIIMFHSTALGMVIGKFNWF